MAKLSVPTQPPPEVVKHLNGALRGNRPVIIGPASQAKFEVFAIQNQPQAIAAALVFKVGCEVASLYPTVAVKLAIGIKLF